MEQRRFIAKLLAAEFEIVMIVFIILRSDPEFVRWLLN